VDWIQPAQNAVFFKHDDVTSGPRTSWPTD